MNDNTQSSKASVILIGLTDTIGNVKDDIRKFFSSTEGKGDRIKKVYRAINNGEASTKRIQIRDVNFAIRTYIDDYYAGLKKFVTEILSIQDSGSLQEKESEISSNIESAKSKDSTFIKSLFDDLRNPINGDEALPNTMKSLEALVDFLDKLDSIEDDIKEFMKMVTSKDTEGYIINGISLYSNSVVMFVNETVNCIKDIFDDIENTVFGNGPKISDNKEEFKLFD